MITDSHFAKRNRLGRLVTWVARLRKEDPAIVGLGVDENTALCIDARGEGRVFTDTGGAAWLVQPQEAARQLQPGRPLSIRDVRITGIGAASRLSLHGPAVTAPAFERVASARDGRLELREAGIPRGDALKSLRPSPVQPSPVQPSPVSGAHP